MGDRFARSDENPKKNLYIDSNNLYVHGMSQSLSYAETKFDEIVKLEDKLKTSDKPDIGCFIGVDLKNLDTVNTKILPFCHYHKINPEFRFSDYMNDIKPKSYTQKKI